MKTGTIMILGPDKNAIGRKVFDLKIIQTFPIISTEAGKTKLITDTEEINIDEYQHLSTPPDLNLHLTKSVGNNRHLSFDIDLVDSERGTLKEDFVHLFNWRSRPISNYREPSGAWDQAQVICLQKDKDFTVNTSIFIDFFVFNLKKTGQEITKQPYFHENMRFIGDNHGNIIGPYKFDDLVRGRHKIKANYYFAIRFGYYESSSDCAILHIPFKVR